MAAIAGNIEAPLWLHLHSEEEEEHSGVDWWETKEDRIAAGGNGSGGTSGGSRPPVAPRTEVEDNGLLGRGVRLGACVAS